MPSVLFITHANVSIDPDVPVPEWGLSERGRRRHMRFNEIGPIGNVTAIYSSAERKAREGASILSEHVGTMPHVIEPLHENDRSATGFLPPDEFERVADAFFARPYESVRGWERANDAQARIVAAVETLLNTDRTSGDLAIVAHGAVGALLLCHLMGTAIDRMHDQPANGGGNYFAFAREDLRLLHGWRAIDD